MARSIVVDEVHRAAGDEARREDRAVVLARIDEVVDVEDRPLLRDRRYGKEKSEEGDGESLHHSATVNFSQLKCMRSRIFTSMSIAAGAIVGPLPFPFARCTDHRNEALPGPTKVPFLTAPFFFSLTSARSAFTGSSLCSARAFCVKR